MADEKTGIEKLRELKNIRMASAVRGETIPCRPVSDEMIDSIADQIEREHADALNEKIEKICKLNREIDGLRENREALVKEAKRNQYVAGNFHRERDEALKKLERMEKKANRDLTDEAREVVERLRAIRGRGINFFSLYQAVTKQLPDAIFGNQWDSFLDILCELIEHGGRQDVDVAALRELADDMRVNATNLITTGSGVLSFYEGCIRKAIDGATVPDAGREAAAEWVEQQGGLAVVADYPKMDEFVATLANDFGVSDDVGCGDDLREAVMAELDKRLMPPGMEWPRWDDGKQVSHYDTLEDATAICLALDGSCYSLHYDMSDGERLCLFDGSERIKRPEPEVRGADGLPIKVGETVYTPAGTKMTVRNITGDMVSAGIPTSDRAHAHMLARFLTHTTPDTNERIDKDAIMPPRRYYAEKIGHDVGLKEDEEVFAAVALDLLRRQRELDAKTMGGE